MLRWTVTFLNAVDTLILADYGQCDSLDLVHAIYIKLILYMTHRSRAAIFIINGFGASFGWWEDILFFPLLPIIIVSILAVQAVHSRLSSNSCWAGVV